MLQTSTVDNKPETIQEPQELSTTRVIPPEIQTVWTQVLDLLSKKLRKPSYETWIKPTSLIEISNNEAVIAVKNEFTRNFILQTYHQGKSVVLKLGTKPARQMVVTQRRQLSGSILLVKYFS